MFSDGARLFIEAQVLQSIGARDLGGFGGFSLALFPRNPVFVLQQNQKLTSIPRCGGI